MIYRQQLVFPIFLFRILQKIFSHDSAYEQTLNFIFRSGQGWALNETSFHKLATKAPFCKSVTSPQVNAWKSDVFLIELTLFRQSYVYQSQSHCSSLVRTLKEIQWLKIVQKQNNKSIAWHIFEEDIYGNIDKISKI